MEGSCGWRLVVHSGEWAGDARDLGGEAMPRTVRWQLGEGAAAGSGVVVGAGTSEADTTVGGK